jgi:NAD(P)H-quinone oxidoreductase subunit 4
MLTPLLLAPLLGAIAIGFWPGLSGKQARTGALAISGLALLWTVWLFVQFDLSFGGFQFHEFLPWLPGLGLNYELSLDGLSLLMVALNSLITWIAIWSSDPEIERPRLFYSLLLLVSAGVAGAFVAQNLMLFFLLYEIELVPLYLLIAIWGGEKKAYSATKFLLYTALSGALMLAGFLGTVWLSGAKDFTYHAVMGHDLPMVWQVVLLGLLLVAFGIKIPLVPFHTWLPDTYVSAQHPGGDDAGRRAGEARYLRPAAVWSGAVPRCLGRAIALSGGVGGSERTVRGGNGDRPKRHQAHGGLQLNWPHGLRAAGRRGDDRPRPHRGRQPNGFPRPDSGHSLSPGGGDRNQVGTRNLDVLNGLMNPVRGLPMVSALLVLGGMASAGIPGLVGFVTEFLVFQGSYAVYPCRLCWG